MTFTAAEVLARNLARLRRQRPGLPPLSQAALAKEMAAAGIPWTQSTVALIETGRRQVLVPELLVLSATLLVSIADLLDPPGDDMVRLGDLAWPASILRRVLRNDIEGLLDEDANQFPRTPEAAREMQDFIEVVPALFATLQKYQDEFLDTWGLHHHQMSLREVGELLAPQGTEGAAAARLRRSLRRTRLLRPRFWADIEGPYVAAAARRLWNHSYDEECSRRTSERAAGVANDRSVQTIRGHVTRELDREVLEEMRKVLDSKEET